MNQKSILDVIATSKASVATVGVAVLACLVAGGFLAMPAALADNSAVDNVEIVVPPSCTMGGVVDTAHTTTLISGQSASGIGQTTIKAWCNDAAGYAIFAVGASDNEDGNTYMISNIKSDYNIPTGLNMGSGNSSWAMQLAAGTGSNAQTTPPQIDSDTEGSFGSYHTIPSVYKRVAYRESGTDMDTDVTKTGSYITTTYRVYANNTQPAGTYVGQVKYAMVHPYSEQSSTLISLELALKNAYGDNHKMKVQESDTKSYYIMQDITPTICNNTTIIGEASQVQVIDSRDKKLYWVTKLEDGHCWMTQNLDLDLDSTGALALNSNNTDLNQYGSNNYISGDDGNGNNYGYSCSTATADCSDGVITWVPERSTVTTLNSTTWQNSYDDPYSYDIGPTTVSDGNGSANGHRLNGNYYNWPAAIASNDASNFTASTMGDVSANPQNSICPKSWRLPTISNASGATPGSTNEFRRLNILYNSNLTTNATNLMNAPLYLARSGYISGGSLISAGGGGYYWSSTVNSSECARYLGFYSSGVNPEDNVSRYNGFSVRCVLRES